MTITLKGQLSILRVFIKFLESIHGVEQGLHNRMLIPSVEDEQAVSNSILEAERAEQVLDYLDKYEYASKRHALLTVLWHTGCRMGAAHSLDIFSYTRRHDSMTPNLVACSTHMRIAVIARETLCLPAIMSAAVRYAKKSALPDLNGGQVDLQSTALPV